MRRGAAVRSQCSRKVLKARRASCPCEVPEAARCWTDNNRYAPQSQEAPAQRLTVCLNGRVSRAQALPPASAAGVGGQGLWARPPRHPEFAPSVRSRSHPLACSSHDDMTQFAVHSLVTNAQTATRLASFAISSPAGLPAHRPHPRCCSQPPALRTASSCPYRRPPNHSGAAGRAAAAPQQARAAMAADLVTK